MHYLYLLSLNNGNLYKGTTNNLKRRWEEHRRGKVISTENKRPLKLIYYECYLLKSDASRRERFLKTTEGRRLLKCQLKDVLSKGSSGHSTGRPIG
ncbi:MAG: GIY-YIG nuclease family protein [Candidatus Paceibacterota bacterium]|jgi:putative endonuclease